MSARPDHTELVKRLRAGCPLIPEHDSPDEDCFDYEASNALMREAADALSQEIESAARELYNTWQYPHDQYSLSQGFAKLKSALEGKS